MSTDSKGILYVVATPIGNLGDMTARSVEVLSGADLIAAEDTRHSLPLLRHFGIDTPCTAYHEHNERQASPELVRRLVQGSSIALISDAGTPLLSDPGYHLVKQARDAGCRVIPIPGASALVCALSAAGLPTRRFVFEGFLPAKASMRRKQLQRLHNETATLVFYESTHRILESLQDMQEIFGGDRTAVIAREMTKIHETIHGATLAELLQWVQGRPEQQKGELVILVHGATEADTDDKMAEYQRILGILMDEMPLKQAVAVAERITGGKRNLLYDLAVRNKK